MLVCLASILDHGTSFIVRHRHKNKATKPIFHKIKKAEMLRLRQKKLYEMEKSLMEKRERHSHKTSLLSRKLKMGVHLTKKQEKGRELFLKKQNKIPNLKVKNTFVLRENHGMNIKKNIKKMKNHRKYKRSRVGFNNKIIDRYLESKINKKFTLDSKGMGRSLLDAKEKKPVKPQNDSYLKFSKTSGSGMKGLNGGITYVERSKMTKPLYLNMSPIYDYRGY